jgi:TRAP-type transport system small permease protein
VVEAKSKGTNNNIGGSEMLKKISSVTHAVGVVCLVLVFLSVIVNVISRTLGYSLGGWVEELSGYAVVWSTYLGMAYTFREGRHVKVDLLTENMSPRNRAIMLAISNGACVVFSIVIVKYGIFLTQVAYMSERVTPITRFPVYLLSLAMPFGIGVFTLEAMVDTFHSIRTIMNPMISPDPALDQCDKIIEQDSPY